jgi:hypothetical protein
MGADSPKVLLCTSSHALGSHEFILRGPFLTGESRFSSDGYTEALTVAFAITR